MNITTEPRTESRTVPEAPADSLGDWEFSHDRNAKFRNRFRARRDAQQAVQRREDLISLIRRGVSEWPFETAGELAELLASACGAFWEAKHQRLLRTFRSKLDALRQERENLESQRIMAMRRSDSQPAGRPSR